jgi:signal transduction histidine kinase
LETADIGRELRQLISNIAEEYERKGLLIKLTHKGSGFARVDLVQLRNAITNVLENSVKYKNKGLGHMEITCSADDEQIMIRFADDGPGVPDEALDKLFHVFYRSDPSRTNPSGGSGIGLAITAKLIERLGGTIRSENVPGGGLAVIMVLPRLHGGHGDEENTDY